MLNKKQGNESSYSPLMKYADDIIAILILLTARGTGKMGKIHFREITDISYTKVTQIWTPDQKPVQKAVHRFRATPEPLVHRYKPAIHPKPQKYLRNLTVKIQSAQNRGNRAITIFICPVRILT